MKYLIIGTGKDGNLKIMKFDSYETTMASLEASKHNLVNYSIIEGSELKVIEIIDNLSHG